MKLVIKFIIALLFSSGALNAQIKPVSNIKSASISDDPIQEFYGIKFGTSKEASKAIMKSKGWVVDSEKAGSVVYKENTYLKREANIIIKFVKNEFYEGVVLFYPQIESQILDLYNSIVDDVSLKYGEGDSYESYSYPYEKNDGHLETALSLGKAKFSTYWYKKDGNNLTKKEYNVISTVISENLGVILTFQDSERINIAINEQNKSKLEDL